MNQESLVIGKHCFRSRLIVGTGKYRTNEEMVAALEASGAELITVALGRVNLDSPQEKTILDYLKEGKYTILPNTAGAYTLKDALRIAHLARAAGLGDLVKIEVIGDQKTLLPDLEATLEATRILVSEGYTVMPYMTDDLIYAKKLEQAGAACVMPLASPIGSGLGVQNPLNIRFIKEAVTCPVIVDAGVGTASDAAICMELGVDGVLMNTGIAAARDAVLMAEAMRLAVDAGRKAFLSGRMPKREYGVPSSPQEGFQVIAK